MHVMILLWRIIWIVPYALSWGITYVLARVMYGVHHEVRDRQASHVYSLENMASGLRSTPLRMAYELRRAS